MISVIILTKNEEIHIQRVLDNCTNFSDDIHIVDSGSTDNTLNYCKDYDVSIYHNEWKNYSTQFNWALKNISFKYTYVLRIDADECIDNLSVFKKFLKDINASNSAEGYLINRSMFFLGKKINFGGLFPIPMLRIFKHSHGICEERWMDEHIIVKGNVKKTNISLIDNNLNDLNWWLKKHIDYSDREAFDVVFNDRNHSKSFSDLSGQKENKNKRYLKINVFTNLPFFIGPSLYFIYRYILRLGFLDGINGFMFHFLHAFFYRSLVEYKVKRFKTLIKNGIDTKSASKKIFGIYPD
tara:strand:+ start:8750 stop:9637 length:888 start_codon:yes stop_codon:yes gene_type:complete